MDYLGLFLTGICHCQLEACEEIDNGTSKEVKTKSLVEETMPVEGDVAITRYGVSLRSSPDIFSSRSINLSI